MNKKLKIAKRRAKFLLEPLKHTLTTRILNALLNTREILRKIKSTLILFSMNLIMEKQ